MNELVVPQPTHGALNSEHYQSFEMAKANDDIIGGNDIAKLRSYSAYTRAQAEAMTKVIAGVTDLDDAIDARAEMTKNAQAYANASLFSDQRVGEILRELPTRQGRRTDTTSCVTPQEVTKSEAIKEANIDTRTAYDLQSMAANPEIVQMVIDKATEDGRIVSRSQVLKAIKERDAATKALENACRMQEALEDEIDALRSQGTGERIVEVEVEVESEEAKRRIAELEYLERLHYEDYQRLRESNAEMRKKLDRAKVLLKEKGYEDNASWDISAFTSAANQFLRSYGGKLWAFDQFYRVDEVTQQEFERAITNLAAFATNVAQMIADKKKLGASE